MFFHAATFLLALIPQAAASGIQGSALTSAYNQYCNALHNGCLSDPSQFGIIFADHVGDMFAYLIFGTAVIVTMHGAVGLITSAGNEEGKSKAKKIISAGIIGLLFAIAAEGIINLISGWLESIW